MNMIFLENKNTKINSALRVAIVILLSAVVSGCVFSKFSDILEYGEKLTPLAETVTILESPYEGCKEVGTQKETLKNFEGAEDYLTNYLRHIAARDLNANALVVEKKEIIIIYDTYGAANPTLALYTGVYRCE